MEQKSRWGIGIVGAGGWGGTAHIPAITALEEYEVRAVTGTRIESAQKAAQRSALSLTIRMQRRWQASPTLTSLSLR